MEDLRGMICLGPVRNFLLLPLPAVGVATAAGAAADAVDGGDLGLRGPLDFLLRGLSTTRFVRRRRLRFSGLALASPAGALLLAGFDAAASWAGAAAGACGGGVGVGVGVGAAAGTGAAAAAATDGCSWVPTASVLVTLCRLL